MPTATPGLPEQLGPRGTQGTAPVPGDAASKRGHQPRRLLEEPSFNIHGGAGREAFDLVCFAILLELNSHLPADTCHMSPQPVPWSIAAAAERRLTYQTPSPEHHRHWVGARAEPGGHRGARPQGFPPPSPGGCREVLAETPSPPRRPQPV